MKEGIWSSIIKYTGFGGQKLAASEQLKTVLEEAREYKGKIQDLLSSSDGNLTAKQVEGIYFYLDAMAPHDKNHSFRSRQDYLELQDIISKHTYQARLSTANKENTFDGGQAHQEISHAIQRCDF